jgi:hypothetical protein
MRSLRRFQFPIQFGLRQMPSANPPRVGYAEILGEVTMARKQKQIAVPAGFVDTSGGARGKTWEPGIGDTLHGVCMGKDSIDAKKAGREKAKKGETVTIVRVADKSTGELFSVWESHSLAEFCKAVKRGDEVFLRLNAIKKNGKRRFKDFTSAIKAKKGAK